MTISGNPQSPKVDAIVSGAAPHCIETILDDADAEAGQPPCVDALVEDNYQSVYRYAFRLSGCASTAEDLTQEVFVKAITHVGQLRSMQAQRGWLLAITRREFLRWIRQVSRPADGRAETLDGNDNLAESGNAEAIENRDWVQKALGELSEDAQVALLMYYFEELSYAEIAEQLQIPIGTVMSRLSRAREHVRRNLERLSLPRTADAESAARAHAVIPTPVMQTRSPLSPLPREIKHG